MRNWIWSSRFALCWKRRERSTRRTTSWRCTSPSRALRRRTHKWPSRMLRESNTCVYHMSSNGPERQPRWSVKDSRKRRGRAKKYSTRRSLLSRTRKRSMKTIRLSIPSNRNIDRRSLTSRFNYPDCRSRTREVSRSSLCWQIRTLHYWSRMMTMTGETRSWMGRFWDSSRESMSPHSWRKSTQKRWDFLLRTTWRCRWHSRVCSLSGTTSRERKTLCRESVHVRLRGLSILEALTYKLLELDTEVKSSKLSNDSQLDFNLSLIFL